MYFRLLCILCFTQLAFSQNSKLNKANRLYLEHAYVKAASLYEDFASDQESLIKLGDCYYYNGQMEQATVAYSRAKKEAEYEFSKAVSFRYAHALYGSNSIKKADSVMSKLYSKTINTNDFITSLINGVPYVYTVEKIKHGSLPGDFGMNYFGDDYVFSSSRNNDTKHYTWNEMSYLDLFKAQLTEDKSLINIEPLDKIINSNTHESGAIISKDGNTMYFSRTNNKRYEVNGEKVATVKLFKSTRIDDSWSEAEELPFSSDYYSTQHPSLDEANGRLYFSSDMPNGFGSFDIYYVDIIEEGFGKPINLGSKINTNHREHFPYYSDDDFLYFSSDGHQGLGGLDIFMVEKDDNNWHTPLNLGETINTNLDDFAFVVDSKNNTGFLSSNRDGKDDLYVFEREKNLRTFIVEGTVKDKNSQELLPGTLITLFNEHKVAIDSVVVSDDGTYSFRTKPNTTYIIEGFKPLYIPTNKDFNTDDSGRIELNIELELESYDDAEEIIVEKEDGYVYIELENIYFDLDKWNIKPQAARTLDVLVALMKKYPRMEVQLGAHTDNRSSVEYNLKLSNNRAQSSLEYLIANGIESSRLVAIGYGESQLLVNCGDDCTENEHAVNRRCEFIITK